MTLVKLPFIRLKTADQTGLTLARVALRPVRVGALLVGLGGAPGRAVVHIRAAVVGPTLHLWIYPFSIYLFYPSLNFIQDLIDEGQLAPPGALLHGAACPGAGRGHGQGPGRHHAPRQPPHYCGLREPILAMSPDCKLNSFIGIYYICQVTVLQTLTCLRQMW